MQEEKAINKPLKVGNEFVLAKYTLSKRESRAFVAIVAALANMQENDQSHYVVKLTYKTLANIIGIGIETGYTNKVRAVLNSLRKREISIQERTSQKEEYSQWLDANLISSIKAPGDGTVEIKIDSVLIPYFINLVSAYTTLDVKYLISFNSQYSFRIYQIIQQFKNTGFRRISIETLRDVLQIGDKYPRTNDFKRFVIDPAINDINEKTPLNITYKFNGGVGKKQADHISFYFGTKDDIDINVETNKNFDLKNTILKLGVDSVVTEKIFNEFDYERILNNYQYVIHITDSKIPNLPGYLVTAIKNDYAKNANYKETNYELRLTLMSLPEIKKKELYKEMLQSNLLSEWMKDNIKRYHNLDDMIGSDAALAIIRLYMMQQHSEEAW